MIYSTDDVAVSGGDLRVGIWQPESGETSTDILLIHGVTASHRAFDLLVKYLPGVRIIAPDLRGRGRSSGVLGDSNMSVHAADMIAVLDHFGVTKPTVVGHSMGAFVGVVLAYKYPERVNNLVLIDGGLPLEVPEGLTPDEIIQNILGPTAERLSRTFATAEDYMDFWRNHPGLGPFWSDFMVDYCRYDLDGEPGNFRAATSYKVAMQDTVDLNAGHAVRDALAQQKVRTHFVTCPRGLLNQVPGLYSSERVVELMQTYPGVTHEEVPDVNHYTIVMAEPGAQAVAKIILEKLE